MTTEEPLHSLALHDRRLWWACSEAERPDNGFAVYDEQCPACRLKAAAEAAMGKGPHTLVNIETGIRSTIADLAAGLAP